MALALCASGLAPEVAAGDNYALVVTGASGGEPYADEIRQLASSFVSTLREKFVYPDDHVIVLAEKEGAGVAGATRERGAADAADLRDAADQGRSARRAAHRSRHAGRRSSGEDAKFNLVGPDLQRQRVGQSAEAARGQRRSSSTRRR